MELVETTFKQVEQGFEHTVKFEFEKRTFLAVVQETTHETYIRDCYEVLDNLFPIDIPKHFGDFKSDVYTFIYENVRKGLPLPPEEDNEVVVEEGELKMDKLLENYFDKNGKEIKKGMTLQHDDGTLDTVFAGDTHLGFIASKDGSLIYPLHEFDLSEWAIVDTEDEKQ